MQTKALLDAQNNPLGLCDAQPDARTITVAGGFTSDGRPVNCTEFRVSASQRAISKAESLDVWFIAVGDVWAEWSVAAEHRHAIARASAEQQALRNAAQITSETAGMMMRAEQTIVRDGEFQAEIAMRLAR